MKTRAAVSLALLLSTGCGWFADEMTALGTIDLSGEDRENLQVLLNTEATPMIAGSLETELLRILAASGRYGRIDIARVNVSLSIFDDPNSIQTDQTLAVIETRSVESDAKVATRIPWVWDKVSPSVRVTAMLSVLDGTTWLPGVSITGEGLDPWDHRWFAEGKPAPVDAASRHRISQEAAEDLARQVGDHLDRLAEPVPPPATDTDSQNG